MVLRTRLTFAGSGALALLIAGGSWSQAQVPVQAPVPAAVRVPTRQAPGAVLPGFSRQGGIGTTPFLGNTRGMGAYSVNYDLPRTGAVHPQPQRVYRPNANRRWFRGWR